MKRQYLYIRCWYCLKASFTAKKNQENLLKIAITYLPNFQITMGKQIIDGLTYKNLYLYTCVYILFICNQTHNKRT